MHRQIECDLKEKVEIISSYHLKGGRKKKKLKKNFLKTIKIKK